MANKEQAALFRLQRMGINEDQILNKDQRYNGHRTIPFRKKYRGFTLL
jgi:hypothetical protein